MGLHSSDLTGKVALVTGASNGIGSGVARRWASLGGHVVVADIDGVRGPEVAQEVGGVFVQCDVSEPAHNAAAVAAAVEHFGGLDFAHLNAGISSGCTLGEDFDVETYRRAMAINTDGVVFGVHAALPALRARGGGAIVATASLAGLTAMPMDPIYGANKAAVVGLVRALGPSLAADNITVNAVCPSFARTAIIGSFEEVLVSGGVPILDVDEVVDAVIAAATSEGTGECWYVVPGRPSEPFRFRGTPGPRLESGERAPALGAEQQVAEGVGARDR